MDIDWLFDKLSTPGCADFAGSRAEKIEIRGYDSKIMVAIAAGTQHCVAIVAISVQDMRHWQIGCLFCGFIHRTCGQRVGVRINIIRQSY